jgi:hypothetical protein
MTKSGNRGWPWIQPPPTSPTGESSSSDRKENMKAAKFGKPRSGEKRFSSSSQTTAKTNISESTLSSKGSPEVREIKWTLLPPSHDIKSRSSTSSSSSRSPSRKMETIESSDTSPDAEEALRQNLELGLDALFPTGSTKPTRSGNSSGSGSPRIPEDDEDSSENDAHIPMLVGDTWTESTKHLTITEETTPVVLPGKGSPPLLMTGGEPTQEQIAPSKNDTTKVVSMVGPVPQYEKTHRMLMPSPLPSPQGSFRLDKRRAPAKQFRPSHDSDTEDEQAREARRKKREETEVQRLVHMAKQQQTFAAAWFAASQGDEVKQFSLPPMSRRPPMTPLNGPVSKSSRRKGKGKKKSKKKRKGDGPIDCDSGASYTGEDDESTIDGNSSVSSNTSSKMGRMVGALMAPGFSRKNESDDDSTVSGSFAAAAAPRRKSGKQNSSLPEGDLEMGRIPPNGSSSVGGTKGSDSTGTFLGRKVSRLTCIIIAFVAVCLLSSLAFVAVFLVDSNKDDKNNANAISRSDTSIPTLVPTGPTTSPTFSSQPTQPSESPSLLPSGMPSIRPTDTPSLRPSTYPSALPSVTPSFAPSISLMPSSAPSSAPTTVYNTLEYSQVGPTLASNQPQNQIGNQFGYHLGMSKDGTRIIVGSPNHLNDNGGQVGQVQVYQSMGTPASWVPLGQALEGRNGTDQFGFRVAFNDAGTLLAVSDPRRWGPNGRKSGAARVFGLDQNNEWVQVGQELVGKAANDVFGVSLDLSGDGTTLAVGTNIHQGPSGKFSGAIWIYRLDSSGKVWEQVGQSLYGTDLFDYFGWDVSLSTDGSTLAVGAPRNTKNGGYVRVFDLFDPTEWKQRGLDLLSNFGINKADDKFGSSVSLSSDGNRVAIGAIWKEGDGTAPRNAGTAQIFQFAGTTWSQMGNSIVGLGESDLLGASVSLSSDGTVLAVGSPGHATNGVKSGLVRVYTFFAEYNSWEGTQAILGEEANDSFGLAVSLSGDGKYVAAGAPSSNKGIGSVRLFQKPST